MFAPDTPMTLTDVTFTTETVDEETRRVVVCTFALAPFTAAQAEALNLRSVLFDSGGSPKAALETLVANISVPDQRLTFAMSPDQVERRIVLANVEIDGKLRAKVKRDREPAVCEAVMKILFAYRPPVAALHRHRRERYAHLTFELSRAIWPRRAEGR
jgi:hypothetical protein